MTPRALAREQTMREIVRIGREQLATVGPAELSLRAVARELGVVSSAVYRYVASRDELLTLLIVDAYDELGDEVDAAVGTGSPRTRLLRIAEAVRTWAVREPSRYALIFGTPVPGYAAPRDQTVDPGTRVVVALVALIEEAYVAGQVADPGGSLPRTVRSDLDAIRREYGLAMPATLLARGFAVWTGIFGAVSFDVFDQYGPDTITDRSALLRVQVGLLADALGLD